MTDDPISRGESGAPDFPDVTEADALVSAYLDGELTGSELSQVEADRTLETRIDELSRARDSLREVPSMPEPQVDAQIEAALASAEWLDQSGTVSGGEPERGREANSNVVSLDGRRASRWGAALGAVAAVIALVAGALSLVESDSSMKFEDAGDSIASADAPGTERLPEGPGEGGQMESLSGDEPVPGVAEAVDGSAGPEDDLADQGDAYMSPDATGGDAPVSSLAPNPLPEAFRARPLDEPIGPFADTDELAEEVAERLRRDGGLEILDYGSATPSSSARWVESACPIEQWAASHLATAIVLGFLSIDDLHPVASSQSEMAGEPVTVLLLGADGDDSVEVIMVLDASGCDSFELVRLLD